MMLTSQSRLLEPPRGATQAPRPASLGGPSRTCGLARCACPRRGGKRRVTTTTIPTALSRRYRPYNRNGSPPPDREWEPSRSGGKQKEPFDAELTVLFGLPTLVLGLPLIIEEPASLVFLVPLLVLIPGVRDIAGSVGRGFAVGAFRAKDFMSEPQQQGQAAARRAAGGQPRPPPAGAAGGSYQQPPTQQGGGYFQQRPPDGGSYGGPGGREQPTSFPAGWPQQPERAVWSGPVPDAPYMSGAPSARGSWGARPLAPSDADGLLPGWPAAGPQTLSPGSSEEPGSAWTGPPRSGGPRPRSVLTTAATEGSRVVRPSGRGRVGIDLEARASPAWVQPLLLLFPWLKSWGGLL